MDKNPNILIKEAFQYAIQEINKGVNPTEALKKSAEYHDLNYEFIQRTGEGLNTALHYHHWKTAKDKAAEFPMAQIKDVINDLYNEHEKTANHVKSEQFSSSELFNPIPDLDKIYNRPQYKEAYLKIVNAPKDTKPSLSANAIYEKSANYIRELDKQLTNAKIKESEAKLNLDASFFNLADSFKKDAAARTSFDEFESQTFTRYGENAIPYLDLIYKYSNLKEERGVHDKGYIMFDDCPELKKLSKFFDYINDVETTTKEASDALTNLEFEKDFVTEIYKSAELLKKKSNNISVDPNMGVDGNVSSEINNKTAAMLTDVFKHLQDQLKGEQKKSPGPQSDAAMDMFEQQAVLQDLLIRDPILSKENPHTVISAYEQLVRISPSVAKEKEVVRAILRQMVAGQALAPHSAGQLNDLETGLLRQRALTNGTPTTK